MILLLGSTGYLGRAFSSELRKRRIEFLPLSRQAVDYTRFDLLFSYVRKVKPDFVINAAGFPGKSDGDVCESSRAEALQANALVPQTLARVCYLSKTPWGHISSGDIFAGAKLARNGGFGLERDLSRPEVRQLFDKEPEQLHGFKESDEPNCSFRNPPCSFYAGTKALAEETLRWFGDGYIWRPNVLFDEFDHPRNVLSEMQKQSRVFDVVNSYSHRGDFVRACLDLWEARASFGIYNVVNPGPATMRQIAATLTSVFGGRHIQFCDTESEFREATGKTPQSGRILDSSKLRAAGVRIRTFRDALQESLKRWQPTPANEEWPAAAASSGKAR